MGNILSDEENSDDHDFGLDLKSPDADGQMNDGTAEPNCQPKQSQSINRRNSASNLEGELQQQEQQEQNESMQPQAPQKLSYLQMAKMGYQELVNAIIRPPRADYKVQ
jgi:protein subunit release factor B